jgi:CheY-like chemotaxis protein
MSNPLHEGVRAVQRDTDIQALNFLIVDDDDNFLAVLAAVLRALGASRIMTARTGSDALTKLAASKRPVDCVLCDLKMPSGNGLQLLKAIRTGKVKAVRPDICFIFITAAADSEFIQIAAQLDVNGYVVKPVTREKMLPAIVRGRSKAFAIDIKQYETIVVPDDAF